MKQFLFFVFLFLSSVANAQGSQPGSGDHVKTAEAETAVKEMVEKFLEAAGNYNVAALRPLFLPNANIGGLSLREGKWTTFTITAEAWFESISKKVDPRPYTEPVSTYTIHISEGRLAFVKADAILHRDGQPWSHNMDFFVLMKDNGTWKFLSGSYTSVPVK